jgi:hypothetical protein
MHIAHPEKSKILYLSPSMQNEESSIGRLNLISIHMWSFLSITSAKCDFKSMALALYTFQEQSIVYFLPQFFPRLAGVWLS